MIYDCYSLKQIGFATDNDSWVVYFNSCRGIHNGKSITVQTLSAMVVAQLVELLSCSIKRNKSNDVCVLETEAQIWT